MYRSLRRATKALRGPGKRLIFPWLIPVLGAGVAWWLRLTLASNAYTRIESPAAQGLRESGVPFILVGFHGRQFPLFAYIAEVPLVILTSLSDVGWVEACFLRRLGAGVERGSDTRGGARALIQLRRHLDEGRAVGISVDGPKGPHECVKAGAIYLARKAGVALLPAAASFQPTLRLSRIWDRSFVPLPFAKLTVVVGDPIHVRRDGGDEVIAEEQARVRETLIAIGKRADRAGHPGDAPAR
jgi:lysophospholipid acyltransferase (LPLAT)-like uncharacterized protein